MTTSRRRIALATCRSLRPEERDDDALRHAFLARGCTIAEPAWDDSDVDWSAFDATLIRTTWDYTERARAFADWAERVDACGLLLNPAPVVRWNLDKRYLAELEIHGVPTVPTEWIETHDALADGRWRDAILARRCPGIFVKPSVGATASGTLRSAVDQRGLERVERHAGSLLDRGVAVLVQPYLDGVETLGERSAIVIDGRITHAVSKRPQPGDYRVQDDWGGVDSPHTLTPTELRLVDATLAALARVLAVAAPNETSPLTYARIDWLTDREGQPRLVELELIEPSLFFRHGPEAAEALVATVLQRIDRTCREEPVSSPPSCATHAGIDIPRPASACAPTGAPTDAPQ